ncbi:MAG: glycoside hydrolase family 2 TIM barrel-domain containing protein [Verrucomicrobiota bacterium]|jgi:beta-galactosidase
MKKVEFVYLTYVRTTPEKLWEALTARLCTVAIGCLIAVQAFTASSAAPAELKRENNFDREWRFLKGDAPGAENAALNDSAWRTLDLPHDWSLEDLQPAAGNGSSVARSVLPEPTNSPATGGGRGRGRVNFEVVGPFSPESPGGTATGYTVGGTGWYRKHFVLDNQTLGKRVTIEFDGIYMDSDVWLNGHHLGNHPYGYTAFAYDLTEFLNPPRQENVLAVRVRNLGRNSRWYSGSGIYRHVVLRVTDPLRFGQWGVSVTTPQVSKERATVNVVTTVENGRNAGTALMLRVKLRGPTGRTLQTGETSAEVAAGGHLEIPLAVEVKLPPLWSPDTPVLCQAEVELLVGGKAVDATTAAFGIRELKFSVENGFTLNGVSVKLRGGCMHHDNGPLGSAAIDRAEERRVELMKASGYNAIRTSHNPPSSAFLDACDRLGVLVLDEAFDCWERTKNPNDFGKYFDEWWQRDLDSMILRDRNHPCVILWSIGNEINERADESGYVVAKQLSDEVRRLDPTRPVTEAICGFWDHPGRQWSDTEKAFTFLDVGGYNYQAGQYERDHQKFPNRIMVGTESYPRDIADIWRIVERNPYVLGDFVWTCMDYLGEAGIGAARLGNERGVYFDSYCGDLDICGFKKAASCYRDVVWGLSQLEVFVHRPIPEGRRESVAGWGWPDELASWTWPDCEGKPMQVAVYSRCDSVRLELNGKEIATKQINGGRLTARFEVPYAAGELKAVGLKNGTKVATKVLRTVGPAKKVRLTVDRSTIRADRNDLAYVTVEITDASGNPLPDATNLVRFTLIGPGELAAVGSGAPNVMESFRQPQHTACHGRCLAILRPQGPAGKLALRAEADGLSAAEVTVRVK